MIFCLTFPSTGSILSKVAAATFIKVGIHLTLAQLCDPG